MDGVLRGLAGQLQGIFRGQSRRKILRSSTASPRKTLSFPTLLLKFTFFLNRFLQLFKKLTRCRADTIFAMLIKATYDANISMGKLYFCKKFVSKDTVSLVQWGRQGDYSGKMNQGYRTSHCLILAHMTIVKVITYIFRKVFEHLG